MNLLLVLIGLPALVLSQGTYYLFIYFHFYILFLGFAQNNLLSVWMSKICLLQS